MSRSVHTTRKDLREARLRSYREDKIKASEIAKAERELALKRDIKGTVAESRSTEEVGKPEGLGSPVSVRFVDNGQNILHPAIPEDFEAIQRRLPGGILEGLSEIVLNLGEHSQAEGEETGLWDPDPITGRLGHEVLPGIYKGWIWGTYDSSACRITLHAIVTDPAKPCVMPTTAYLKLQILSTFVHEVAHHFDFTRRVARGRWRASDKEKIEHFAEHRQQEWTQTCVVPYLEEAYPHQVAELLDWLEVHGGIRFDFEELISDPRHAYVSTIETAVNDLLSDVMQEIPVLERRLSFAVNLKIADRYERAQEVIDRILAEAPDCEDALELRADTWTFQENYAEAARLALFILGRNPLNWRARATLTRAYEGLSQWAKVIAFATESLSLFTERLDRIDATASRCAAYWKVGEKEESDEDLRTLQSLNAPWRIKRILRERESNSYPAAAR